MSPNQARHVYVDTKYLHAFIFPDRRNDEEQFAKEEFKQLLYSRDNFFLKVPLVVIGETINNIHRRTLTEVEKSDIVRNLLNVMAVDKVDLPPATSSCFELTNDLLSEDNRLDATDALIVAQALCDPLSTHLLMKDEKVITSATIMKVNKELYDDGNGQRPKLLKITPEMGR